MSADKEEAARAKLVEAISKAERLAAAHFAAPEAADRYLATPANGDPIDERTAQREHATKLPPCGWCDGTGKARDGEPEHVPGGGLCVVCRGTKVLVSDSEQLEGLILATGLSSARVRAFQTAFGQRLAVGAMRYAFDRGITLPGLISHGVGGFQVRPGLTPERLREIAASPPAAPPSCPQCRGSGLVETIDSSVPCACQRNAALKARAYDARVTALAIPGKGFQRAVHITILVEAQPSPEQMVGAGNVAAAYLNSTQHPTKKDQTP